MCVRARARVVCVSVEGSEAEVVRGARHTLLHDRPVLTLEAHTNSSARTYEARDEARVHAIQAELVHARYVESDAGRPDGRAAGGGRKGTSDFISVTSQHPGGGHVAGGDHGLHEPHLDEHVYVVDEVCGGPGCRNLVCFPPGAPHTAAFAVSATRRMLERSGRLTRCESTRRVSLWGCLQASVRRVAARVRSEAPLSSRTQQPQALMQHRNATT